MSPLTLHTFPLLHNGILDQAYNVTRASFPFRQFVDSVNYCLHLMSVAQTYKESRHWTWRLVSQLALIRYADSWSLNMQNQCPEALKDKYFINTDRNRSTKLKLLCQWELNKLYQSRAIITLNLRMDLTKSLWISEELPRVAFAAEK